MAVYDTEENNRTDYTGETIASLVNTVNLTKHRLVIIDNASCERTKTLLSQVVDIYSISGSGSTKYNYLNIEVITLPENIGTARAINKAWELRQPGEHCIKMDNDVVIHQKGWVDKLVECIDRDPQIGIIGLKRKDLWENPAHENPFYRSHIKMLPHQPGQNWLFIEQVQHVMGTCQMYNSALLDKIGYLYQPGLYGFDDVLAAPRCQAAGFYNCFYPHIEIDHIDTGEDNPYQRWKHEHINPLFAECNRLKEGYLNGTIDIYYPADYATHI